MSCQAWRGSILSPGVGPAAQPMTTFLVWERWELWTPQGGRKMGGKKLPKTVHQLETVLGVILRRGPLAPLAPFLFPFGLRGANGGSKWEAALLGQLPPPPGHLVGKRGREVRGKRKEPCHKPR